VYTHVEDVLPSNSFVQLRNLKITAGNYICLLAFAALHCQRVFQGQRRIVLPPRKLATLPKQNSNGSGNNITHAVEFVYISVFTFCKYEAILLSFFREITEF